MCLVGNATELKKKLSYLVPLIERLDGVQGALSTRNKKGEDAIYLASKNCPQMSFVAGYVAASYLKRGIDLNKLLYGIKVI